ncbi:MAG: isochorismatase family protein [Methyloligellaceae bacterium]
MRLERHRSQLLIIDMQDQILAHAHEAQRVTQTCAHLIESAKRLKVPVMISEQDPKTLGPTAAPLLDGADHTATIIGRTHFSCLRDGTLGPYLEAQHRFGCSQVVVAGTETHVSVGQTVLDLLDHGFGAFVVADAVASRHLDSHVLALDRLRQCGAQIVDFETVLLEWLDRTGTDAFKDLEKLISKGGVS